MALFKSLLKKEAPAASASGFPLLYSGMKVEVLTPTNVLLFVGRLKILGGGEALEIRSESGDALPPVVYNQQVKIQGIQKNGESFTLNGAVGPNAPDFWRIERLRVLQKHENRNFFRMVTGVDGWVYPVTSSQGQRFSCKVLDISAGGARVVTQKLFQLESMFQLECAPLPETAPFTFTCKVRRVLAHSKPGSPGQKFEYGCQFVDLPAREQERLVQALFTLQRRARSRRES